MATIGVDSGGDDFVVWANRDFRWKMKNLNDNGVEENYPPGDLYAEFDVGGQQNARQRVEIVQAEGGTYTLEVGGAVTDPIDYYDKTENPYDQGVDVTDALEALPTVGPGNVKVHPARLTPAWEIHLELNAGVNEVQQILTRRVAGGNWRAVYDGEQSVNISGTADAAEVQAALEGISTIGANNVVVREIPGTGTDQNGWTVEFVGALAAQPVDTIVAIGWGFPFYFLTGVLPTISTTVLVPGTAKLSETMVNLINTEVNRFFDQLENLFGVDLTYVITDEKNMYLQAVSRKDYDEHGFITFAIDITQNALEGAFNAITGFTNIFAGLTINFYWNHKYEVEFINQLGEMPQNPIIPDTSSLTSSHWTPTMPVTVLNEGHRRKKYWHADIAGSEADFYVPADQVDEVPQRAPFQVVFYPAVNTGEQQLLLTPDAEDNLVTPNTLNWSTDGWDTNQSRSGTQSYKCVADGANAAYFYLPQDQAVGNAPSVTSRDVEPGEWYEAHCWFKYPTATKSANGTVRFRAYLLDSTDQLSNFYPSTETWLLSADEMPEDEWTYISLPIRVPFPDVHGDFYDRLQVFWTTTASVDANTEFYFDDWSLHKLSPVKGGDPVTWGRVRRIGGHV